jgi:phenylalanyl-tRNA synthetase beta chain
MPYTLSSIPYLLYLQLMKISYNWLKDYINPNLNAEEAGKLLTDTGLEVESIEQYQTIKGNLEGVVIGQVITCEKHPGADRLSKTTVDIGIDRNLEIVCGAPNVAAGQKVAVATVGTKLYFADGKELVIKVGNIRGEKSEGMICAEDELGLGTDHDGIIVLPEDAPVGTPVNKYWADKIYADEVFEIGLTPNRVDAASHLGVARDMVAKLNIESNGAFKISKPSVDSFTAPTTEGSISINVTDHTLAPRYTGIEVKGVKVGPSPAWLENRIKAIGLRPINNVVDITNYVLHETGQPLHAFDAAKIDQNVILVKTVAAGTKFTTLDGKERNLNGSELMICNANNPMCIAGVMGGMDSGVSESTVDIFIESAYFDPVSVRKTAKLHGLKTDSSFRFERGADPNMAIYALKRAALLITEICGGTISSSITDIYPEPIGNRKLTVNMDRVYSLIGKEIGIDTVKHILNALEIDIMGEAGMELTLSIPPFKTDVTREADVAEEILRIYGYNNIDIPTRVKSSINYTGNAGSAKIKEAVSAKLSALGFYEALSNSLTSTRYHTLTDLTNPEEDVRMLNPLSSELDVMRQSLLFSALEAISRNVNHRNTDVKLYEFGRTYRKTAKGYEETNKMALVMTGNTLAEAWQLPARKADFYSLKGYLYLILEACNLTTDSFKISEASTNAFAYGLNYNFKDTTVLFAGEVSPKVLKELDIKQPVVYAEINWTALTKMARNTAVKYKELPKYPEVRRDLALLVDKATEYIELKNLAYEVEKKLLRNVNLFDVYEGKNLEEGKKSYALSFTLRDDEKTLTDEEIDNTMGRLLKAFEKAGAKLRS